MTTEHPAVAESRSVSEPRSVFGQFSQLAVDLTDLMRAEVSLAKAELREKTDQAVTAAAAVLAGAVLGMAALIVLLQALVIAITNAGVPPGWAALAVGVGVALIGFFMARKGLSDLKAQNLAPRRSAESLKRDAVTIKEHLAS